MSITTTTHLNFAGTARQALEFYQTVFGGTVTIATYADFGMPAEVPGSSGVVFGQVESADGFRIMAYDTLGDGPADLAGTTRRENGATITNRTFFVSVRGESLDEVSALWSGLKEGAEVLEPLAASAWSPGFGMLTDQFGVTWVLDVQQASAA